MEEKKQWLKNYRGDEMNGDDDDVVLFYFSFFYNFIINV